MRGARGEVVLGPRVEAEQQSAASSLTLARRNDLSARHHGLDLGLDPFAGGRVDEVCLVQDDEVRAEQLVLEDLFQRIVVVDAGIGGALRGDLGRIVGETAGGDGGRIDHGDDAVDGEAAPHVGPVERLHQRLR